MRRGPWLLPAGMLFCLCLSACEYHTATPPIRYATSGAPAMVTQGRAQIGSNGTVRTEQSKKKRISESGDGEDEYSGSLFRTSGGLDVTVGVTDFLAIEAGGMFSRQYAVLGFGGVRGTPIMDKNGRKFFLDVAIGGGGGKGGQVCTNYDFEACRLNEDDWECSPCEKRWDGVKWIDRTLYGGYVELGFGWRFHRMIELYIRPRYEFSSATGVPMTHWIMGYLAMQLNVNEILRFHAGLAPSYFTNAEDYDMAILFELGLSVTFGKSKDEAPLALNLQELASLI